ncbi:hypothetical protein P691DRAFT_757578 [Macrolepiota fuliginosa MF-IS2]|uniref:DUF6533 domain-containing protein n=1 Tax=Macrolepiota fuliginosa MF-IS2 TaxID=1400762 RepID=A0A9P5XHL6_9AGAR|nr:hypothetical protein P691DRAFT_757578 [Macrolepiota fuliginosa MF-IS2]
MSLLNQITQGIQEFQKYRFVDGMSGNSVGGCLLTLQCSNSTTAALVIYSYDYFLTINQEVRLVWHSKWNFMKAAFLFNRYFIIVNIIIQHFRGTDWAGTEAGCQRLEQTQLALEAFGLFFSEMMLCLRLCVMWHNDKRFIAGAIITCISTVAFLTHRSEITLEGGRYLGIMGDFKGCSFAVTRKTYVNSLVVLCYDTAVLVLSLIPTIRLRDPQIPSRPSLIVRVYHEGVIFYVYLLVSSIITLPLVIQNPGNGYMIVPVVRSVRVILSIRMVLHIRQLCAADYYPTLESFDAGQGAVPDSR